MSDTQDVEALVAGLERFAAAEDRGGCVELQMRTSPCREAATALRTLARERDEARGFKTRVEREARVRISDEAIDHTASEIAGAVGPNDEAQAVERAVKSALVFMRSHGELRVTNAESRASSFEAQLAGRDAEIAKAVAALDEIYTYCNDTLSGRADGGPDDRAWQREAVIRARNLARPFARPGIAAAIRARATERAVVAAGLEVPPLVRGRTTRKDDRRG